MELEDHKYELGVIIHYNKKKYKIYGCCESSGEIFYLVKSKQGFVYNEKCTVGWERGGFKYIIDPDLIVLDEFYMWLPEDQVREPMSDAIAQIKKEIGL